MLTLSDTCIPDDTTDFLRRRGWGIVYARTVGVENQPDAHVWAVSASS